MKCNCWNIKHQKYCPRPATELCMACGDRLCKYCVKNHHAHPQSCMPINVQAEGRA